ncbi:hypothetical protein LOTGIDRAFT_158437 [Lottia gigantea]|uniref:L1 transposable element RRM domain-containing protein n=1 Tax=Lottia gigantea TaxID=225164 RepID=V4AWI2_LOTGI|nr:hypothetical protein LOTGIDRAFT_158437 [Lottia gigantea]ESO99350.1 hypothetical protein LOTGIDRAFT_158437 [Lottia gigantea]
MDFANRHTPPINAHITGTSLPSYTNGNYATSPTSNYLGQASTALFHPGTNTQGNLEHFITDIYQKLQKMDLLDQINQRLCTMESRFDSLERTIYGMKTEIGSQAERLDGLEFQRSLVDDRMHMLAIENKELKERMLDIQTRSMKDNLLFGGIEDTGDINENTEEIVQTFIKDKLQISEDIRFHVVHRLRKQPDGKPRTIVAKFESSKDKIKETLREWRPYSVYEQYPQEINERRKLLITVFKDARRLGNRASLNIDKLYINGRLHRPGESLPPQFTRNQDPPNVLQN